MEKVPNYETIYRKNGATDRVMIDIALADYLEFFHEWDNAAFKKRDMHPELAQFLDLCSKDIPLRKKLEIVFCMHTAKISPEKEEQVRISYRNYYNSLNRLERQKTKTIVRFSGICLFTSLVLLSSYTLVGGVKANTIIAKVLLESLLIGGWVFAWEAVHLLFLDIIEPFHRRREIKRFLEADLSFSYLFE